ncbi:hypothetical protein H5410_034516 [Solanum commersonii]|uniref:Uncharacterized protein n=1 Tax=Solanum commersonii TaxID=4109 RepID=A0A9J5YRW8_SOLCO|nr:hypothetical protein H5410_034516 [Solanum commersonii]
MYIQLAVNRRKKKQIHYKKAEIPFTISPPLTLHFVLGTKHSFFFSINTDPNLLLLQLKLNGSGRKLIRKSVMNSCRKLDSLEGGVLSSGGARIFTKIPNMFLEDILITLTA